MWLRVMAGRARARRSEQIVVCLVHEVSGEPQLLLRRRLFPVSCPLWKLRSRAESVADHRCVQRARLSRIKAGSGGQRGEQTRQGSERGDASEAGIACLFSSTNWRGSGWKLIRIPGAGPANKTFFSNLPNPPKSQIAETCRLGNRASLPGFPQSPTTRRIIMIYSDRDN